MKLLVELRSGDAKIVRRLLDDLGYKEVEIEPSFSGAHGFGRSRFVDVYLSGDDVHDPVVRRVITALNDAPEVERVTPEPPLPPP